MKNALWNSKCKAWRDALEQYDALILAHAVNELPKIDAWYAKELPKTIAARKPAYVTKDEFLEVLRWKMKRGDWREWNRVRVAETEAQEIKQISKEALSLASTVPVSEETTSKVYKKPVQILCELDGVGPATASAILAAYRPDLYPFFDEWIAKQIPALGKVAFTPSYYWKYADALRGKARELTIECKSEWTAHDLGQALWVASGGKLK